MNVSGSIIFLFSCFLFYYSFQFTLLIFITLFQDSVQLSLLSWSNGACFLKITKNLSNFLKIKLAPENEIKLFWPKEINFLVIKLKGDFIRNLILKSGLSCWQLSYKVLRGVIHYWLTYRLLQIIFKCHDSNPEWWDWV